MESNGKQRILGGTGEEETEKQVCKKKWVNARFSHPSLWEMGTSERTQTVLLRIWKGAEFIVGAIDLGRSLGHLSG